MLWTLLHGQAWVRTSRGGRRSKPLLGARALAGEHSDPVIKSSSSEQTGEPEPIAKILVSDKPSTESAQDDICLPRSAAAGDLRWRAEAGSPLSILRACSAARPSGSPARRRSPGSGASWPRIASSARARPPRTRCWRTRLFRDFEVNRRAADAPGAPRPVHPLGPEASDFWVTRSNLGIAGSTAKQGRRRGQSMSRRPSRDTLADTRRDSLRSLTIQADHNGST